MSMDAASEPIISLENIHIGFGEEDVLAGLFLSVAARETMILIGENGSGKTVALKLAAGLLRPDSGRVRVLGHDLCAMPEDELLDFRREIGFVFQEGALFDSLSVEENVAYRLREDGTGEDEIKARVLESLRFVEMEDTIGKLPSELSGGMRRRVSIARALVSRPPVVLYDSPTAGLDPVTAQTIIALVMRQRDTQGVTSLLTTHRLQDAFALANYRFDNDNGRVMHIQQNGAGGTAATARTTLVVLRDGKAYFQGTPQEIVESKDEYLKRFLVQT
jgi:phospholipid/cholesterol/gamma-HCH transport system ATP-binding protein